MVAEVGRGGLELYPPPVEASAPLARRTAVDAAFLVLAAAAIVASRGAGGSFHAPRGLWGTPLGGGGGAAADLVDEAVSGLCVSLAEEEPSPLVPRCPCPADAALGLDDRAPDDHVRRVSEGTRSSPSSLRATGWSPQVPTICSRRATARAMASEGVGSILGGDVVLLLLLLG